MRGVLLVPDKVGSGSVVTLLLLMRIRPGALCTHTRALEIGTDSSMLGNSAIYQTADRRYARKFRCSEIQQVGSRRPEPRTCVWSDFANFRDHEILPVESMCWSLNERPAVGVGVLG